MHFSIRTRYPIQSSLRLHRLKRKNEPRVTTRNERIKSCIWWGIVPGSLILIGGDPGIGKSTLLLQVSSQLAISGQKVLYISGEESLRQTKMRADRLDVSSPNYYIYAETNLEVIHQTIEDMSPVLL